MLKDAGLQMPAKNIKQAFYAHESSREAAHELLTMPERPSAIFAASDNQAFSHSLSPYCDLQDDFPSDFACGRG